MREHSNYASDPWGRLLRTLDYVNSIVYGGPALAAETGRRVRAMHKQIKGIKPDGTRYHALEPGAYAWVHATLAEAIVTANQRFARPLRAAEIEQFYAEWRRLGWLVGVRERDLPDGWSAFRAYFDAMVTDQLENTAAVHDVLNTLDSPKRPPIPGLGERTWRGTRIPIARLFNLATVGTLPAVLRERFGLRWTRAQELELAVLGRASRAATPLMPGSLQIMGPSYLSWRREAISRGDVASDRGLRERSKPAPAAWAGR